jgi:preprotein translocase subunit SecA
MEEGVPIEHRMVTRSIERAQTQVEAQNFSMRKHLLEYDDVMNKQRKSVYGLRRMILEGKHEDGIETREHVASLGDEVLDWYIDANCDEKQDPNEWNLEGLQLSLRETFGLHTPLEELQQLGRDELRETLSSRIRSRYEEKESRVGREIMQFHQRMIMLQIVDAQWKDHLYALDHLKEGIGLRGYGQRDPLVEYKKESFQMYQALLDRIDEEMLKWVHLYQPVSLEDSRDGAAATGAGRAALPAGGGAAARGLAAPAPKAFRNLTFNDPSRASGGFRGAERKEAQGGADAKIQTVQRDGRKVGRNEPCPCGSGKKYKKCHGA